MKAEGEKVEHYSSLPPLLFAGLFLAISLLFGIFQKSVVFEDADIGWHMATGAWILDHQAIPKHDVFSFTAAQVPWVNFSVLPDIIMSALFASGGFALLFAVTFAMVAVAVALTAQNVLQSGATVASSFLVMVCVTYGLTASTIMRPQLVSFLMIPLFYALLARQRQKADALIYLLCPLMVVWVNSHAGFIVGLSMIAAFWLENAVNRRAALPLFYVGVLAFFCTFINSAGAEIYIAAYKLMGAEMTKYVSEWGALGFGRHITITPYFLLMLLACRPFAPQIPLADKLLGMVWWIVALYTARYAPIALLVGAPFLAHSVDYVLRQTALAEDLAQCEQRYAGWLGSTNAIKTIVPCVALVSVVFFACDWQRLMHHQKMQPSHEYYLPKETEYLFDHASRGNILVDYNVAGYFVNDAYQRCGSLVAQKAAKSCNFKVFLDGRVDMAYPAKISHDYVKMFMDANRHWPKMLKKYQVDGLLLQKKSAFFQHFPNHPDWKIVFETKHGAVVVTK